MNSDQPCKCPVHRCLHQSGLGLFVLRASLSLMMLLHGFSKLMNWEGTQAWITSMGLPKLMSYGVLVGEVIAPLLMLIGFRTRAAAAVFAFNMLVAVGLVHLGDVFTLSGQGGWALELQGLYFFGAVALVFTGGGSWAVSRNNLLD